MVNAEAFIGFAHVRVDSRKCVTIPKRLDWILQKAFIYRLLFQHFCDAIWKFFTVGQNYSSLKSTKSSSILNFSLKLGVFGAILESLSYFCYYFWSFVRALQIAFSTMRVGHWRKSYNILIIDDNIHTLCTITSGVIV